MAFTTVLWLLDMVSDVYVTCTYFRDNMYIFGSLLIDIWVIVDAWHSSAAFQSWERCDSAVQRRVVVDRWLESLQFMTW